MGFIRSTDILVGILSSVWLVLGEKRGEAVRG
jgi:hypothetical protein